MPTADQIKKREKMKLLYFKEKQTKAVHHKKLQQPQNAASVLTPKFVGNCSCAPPILTRLSTFVFQILM